MDGSLKTFLSSVPVAKIFWWSMLSLVVEMAFPLCGITKSGTWLLNVLSEVCPNVSGELTFQELSGESLSGGSTNRDSGARVDMWLLMAFGVLGGRGPMPILGFSTPFPLPIDRLLFHQLTRCTRRKRRGNTVKEYARWSMALSLHLCFHRQEEWLKRACTVFYRRL